VFSRPRKGEAVTVGETTTYFLKERTMKIDKAAKKIAKVMGEYKSGKLHSGMTKRVVKNPKQAIAIALSEAGKSKPKGKM